MAADPNRLIYRHITRQMLILLISNLLALLPAVAGSQYPPYGRQQIPPTQSLPSDTIEAGQPSESRFRRPVGPRAWPQQPIGWPPPQTAPYQVPRYQAPQYQAPQYQAPQYQAPQYQAPQHQAPQHQAPQYQAPQYQTPRYQAPQHQAPQHQAPRYQAQPSADVPVIETFISSQDVVEQQNLIYRIKVISSGNLSRAVPQLPEPDGFAIRSLAEPQSHIQQQNNEQRVITEHTYLLVPLRAGKLTLPPANVTGEYKNGRPYDVRSRNPLVLTVVPAIKEIAPWLPLHDLQMQAQLLDAYNLSAGSPMTLEIKINVVGATGPQIPSVASQLQSDDYRLYPEKTTTEGSLSADGSRLDGQRIERFTLVPQYGGKLSIPALHLSWWNIDQRQLQTTTVPIRQFNVKGPANPKGTDSETSSGILPINSPVFWIPLLLASVALLVGWLKVLLGNGRLPGMNWIAGVFKDLLGDLYQPIAVMIGRMSPRRYFHRLRTLVGGNLPVSWKLWFCMRSVDKEDDAEEWGQALQILAHKHLGVRSHASLPELGTSIAACHPRANADKVAMLMRELDQSIYSSQPIQSFAQWKDTFKRQIKPRLFPIRFRHCKQPGKPRRLLPDLNPAV